MKGPLMLFLLMLVVGSYAQDSALQTLVDAERGFAQIAVDKSIRTAFLSYFDENSIAFKKGQPVNGYEDWNAREESAGYLFWWPVCADIASSGEFGYTTGPAEWGELRTEKKAVGGMYYASVWRKDKNGQWKVLADMGSAIYKPEEKKTGFHASGKPPTAPGKKIDVSKTKPELLEYDHRYIEQLNKETKSFSTDYFSNEGRIHRPGRPPVTTPDELKNLTEVQKFTFKQVGGDVAASADMGYTYGKVKVQLVHDEKAQEVPLCYMRVWKKEDGAWKIVLDVIGGG